MCAGVAGAKAADMGKKVDPSGIARKRVQRVCRCQCVVCVNGRCGASGGAGAACILVLRATLTCT